LYSNTIIIRRILSRTGLFRVGNSAHPVARDSHQKVKVRVELDLHGIFRLSATAVETSESPTDDTMDIDGSRADVSSLEERSRDATTEGSEEGKAAESGASPDGKTAVSPR